MSNVISRGGEGAPVHAPRLRGPEEQLPRELGPGDVEEVDGELRPGDGALGVALTRVHSDQVIHHPRSVLPR